MSWHALLHIGFAGIGVASLIAGCFVMAALFSRDGERGWAGYSVLTGTLFAAGFAAVASGSTSTAVVIAFTGAVVVAWAWLTAISIKLYRRVGFASAAEDRSPISVS